MHISFLARVLTPALMLLLAVIWCGSAQAYVRVFATRVVFPASEHEVTLRVRNTDTQPSLLQLWIDRGDEAVPLEQLQIPFIVEPAIVRLDGLGSTALRIFNIGNVALPEDRESLFWLNMLDVPAQPKQRENEILFSVQSRIKLFYRPEAIAERNDKAEQALSFRLEGNTLHIDNRSPFHQTFMTIELSAAGKNQEIDLGETDMVAPFSALQLPVKGSAIAGTDTKVKYSLVNDRGTARNYSAPLTR